ncbi:MULTISPECIES: SDR family oxidoreductase [unclassified Pseudomonas]|uniref:SDR family oxidoreductase n=1 Tax=unclassified Pseudomonas TaxID=196821 RepID=UPI0035C241FC
MNIVVIGGTGLIGTKLVSLLRDKGHQVVAASPSTGVNTLTREGLAEAMDGTEAVIDVSNAPSWEEQAVMDFFQASTRNLLAAEAAAGVRHHVALSIVGSERLPDNGYFRAKVAQEALIEASGIPYSIVRATQFFEFVGGIAQASIVGDAVRVSPALFQPVAADDVVAALADVALGAAANARLEVAGPDKAPLDEMVRSYLRATGDQVNVVADVHARYFGSELDDQSLTAGASARLGNIHFADWLAHNA